MSNTLLTTIATAHDTHASLLFDCGASHDFISEAFCKRAHITRKTRLGERCVVLGDGSTKTVQLWLSQPVVVAWEGWSETRSFHILPGNSNFDIILGKPWLSEHNPTIDFAHNVIEWTQATTGRVWRCEAASQGPSDAPELRFMSAREATSAIKHQDPSYLVWLNDVEVDARPLPTFATTDPTDRRRLQSLVREFSDCFPSEVQGLPPARRIDHRIDIVPGANPPTRKPYRLSQPELTELKRLLEKLLAKGYIRPSVSPFGAPVFFTKKADGSFRFVCDWRELNRITVKNRACIPNVEDLFDRVQGAVVFSHMDLHVGYNQVLIHEPDVYKTAITTPFGHFEWRVMGLGMTNAPATFQTMMNDVLRCFLFDFVVVFLEDILVFSVTR